MRGMFRVGARTTGFKSLGIEGQRQTALLAADASGTCFSPMNIHQKRETS